ncbi:unnamed protein product, partial [Amoebophrya sp. A120]
SCDLQQYRITWTCTSVFFFLLPSKKIVRKLQVTSFSSPETKMARPDENKNNFSADETIANLRSHITDLETCVQRRDEVLAKARGKINQLLRKLKLRDEKIAELEQELALYGGRNYAGPGQRFSPPGHDSRSYEQRSNSAINGLTVDTSSPPPNTTKPDTRNPATASFPDDDPFRTPRSPNDSPHSPVESLFGQTGESSDLQTIISSPQNFSTGTSFETLKNSVCSAAENLPPGTNSFSSSYNSFVAASEHVTGTARTANPPPADRDPKLAELQQLVEEMGEKEKQLSFEIQALQREQRENELKFQRIDANSRLQNINNCASQHSEKQANLGNLISEKQKFFSVYKHQKEKLEKKLRKVSAAAGFPGTGSTSMPFTGSESNQMQVVNSQEQQEHHAWTKSASNVLQQNLPDLSPIDRVDEYEVDGDTLIFSVERA